MGRFILKNIIQEATLSNKTVSLSVLKSNTAQDLYLNMGFKIVAEEESSYLMKYYS
ncbi:N-acetyltransferase [Sphingobacterium tabacisoli]|uniref:N-acetyltransferase domain-containing protein n=1 Tax=Sphingobacterium tabacisoli TaxID=2044855 RepID=A0ABW5L7B0_9SPHI